MEESKGCLYQTQPSVIDKEPLSIILRRVIVLTAQSLVLLYWYPNGYGVSVALIYRICVKRCVTNFLNGLILLPTRKATLRTKRAG